MKKKLVPVLVILALVIVGVGGYMMGQQSNNPVVETPPVENSTPEATPDATPITPVVESTSPEPSIEPVAEYKPISDQALLEYFRDTYEYVWGAPENYNADYNDTAMEIEALSFYIEQDGHTYTDEYADRYIEWKLTVHPENAFHLVFSGSYRNIVMADKMYAYAAPYTTLPPVAEFYRFDEINPSERSEDGTWYRAEHNGSYIYFRYEDLAGGLSVEEMNELYDQHQAELQQPPETEPIKEPVTTPAKEPEPEPEPEHEPEPAPQQSQNTGDANGNGIPDYLDHLINPEAGAGEGVTDNSEFENGHLGEATGKGIEIIG